MQQQQVVNEYWSASGDALLASLGSTADGLTPAQAGERLASFGPNAVKASAGHATLRLLVRQFASPLVLILVFAAGVSLVMRDWIEAGIVLSIVLGSCLLGFSQEYRASNVLAQLQRRLALTVRVRRGGAALSVDAAAIVPGDVIELAAGNLVPADGVLLQAQDFLVSEAALTGESFPAEKQVCTVPADTPLAGRHNCVFQGSSVRSGTATALIVATGRRTIVGGMTESLAAGAGESEFSRGVRRFGYLLIRVMLAIVVAVLAVNFWLERPPLESLLFAVALAVGLSPELLPAIVSVTLSHGARAMAGNGVLVRRLEAIENLGSIDVFCSDKTGTLTAGVIALDCAVDADGADAPQVERLAYLNASFESGIDNPIDRAIIAGGDTKGLSTGGYSKVDEIPYDFMRRRLTIVVAPADRPAEHLVITKGAVAQVLEVCATLRRAGREDALDAAERARLEDYLRDQGTRGFRVLAVCSKAVARQPRYGREDETGMCLEGFLLLFDPPKPEATRAIKELVALGIGIKMITGDNRYVAGHVAAAIGLDPAAMLTGPQIAQMRDEALWNQAPRTDLFVEVDPQQKERIVRALQKAGNAVGYLGDGINDAPALQAADVGISVDQAVDVARASADVILLQPDLEVLRRGVEDGRRTFANTLKYIGITTSANFGNMISMALATPALPFLPLAAKQILLNNFLSDLPSVAISTDRVDAWNIAHPQRWDVRQVRRFMIVFGLISTAFDLVTFGVLRRLFHSGEARFQTAWFVESLLTELAVVLVLRTHGSCFRSAPSRLLIWATVAVSAAALGLPYLEPVARLFGFVPLPPALLLSMLLIVAAYVAATELVKRRFWRRFAAA